MPEEIANGWPVQRLQTLANLQDQRCNAQPSTRGEEQLRRPAGRTEVPHPLSRLNQLQEILPNHRNHILRDRIEGRHRLRIGLERPLRNNQIRKFC
jgi:hypothetical protein